MKKDKENMELDLSLRSTLISLSLENGAMLPRAQAATGAPVVRSCSKVCMRIFLG